MREGPGLHAKGQGGQIRTMSPTLMFVLAKGAGKAAVSHYFPDILPSLSDEMNEQRERLQQIQQELKTVGRKLDDHITIPIKTGMEYIEEARYTRDEARKREHIQKARDEFMSVSNLQPSSFPLVPIKARFYVAVCHDLLGEREHALRWYEKSYRLATQVKPELAEKCQSLDVSKGFLKRKNAQEQMELERYTATNHELNSFINSMTQLFHSWDPRMNTLTSLEGEIHHLKGHSKRITDIAFSPDGAALASGSDDSSVRLWDVNEGKETFHLRGHTEPIAGVVFSPDGSILASGAEDNSVRLWDVQQGQQVHCLEGHSGKVTSIAFSPDGLVLASGSADNSVRLWDVQRGQEVDRLVGHWGRSGGVTCVAFSPNGLILADGSLDFTVRLWDAQAGRGIGHLTTHSDCVRFVAFSPDGSVLASGSDDNSVKLWLVETGELLHDLTKHSEKITSIAFSPDGLVLASGSADSSVRLWDVSSGEELLCLTGHSLGITCLAFSPDGAILASGSRENKVRLWDTQDGKNISHLTEHKGFFPSVTCVAFSPDGLLLASGSGDKTVRLWALQFRIAEEFPLLSDIVI